MNKKDKYEKYTREELVDELETLKKKKYGLVWDKKNSQEVLDAFVNWENVPENFVPKQFPILKEVKNKEIETDKDKPANLLIEGDNYHSLAVLNFTHQNKIDVIYIDPPYNTGNSDFIYNDKFVDKEDPFRHSKWLSFMEKRLRLAHRLLKNTGVIFISIDDNEQAQLKLLCDEIFGEENFIANFVWNSTKSITNPALVSVSHTYNFTYAKDKSVYDLIYRKNFKLPAILEGFSNPDNDPRGLWKADPFETGGFRKNQMYPIKNPNTGEVFYPSKGNCWKNDLDKFNELINDNRIVFGKDGKSRPQRKRFIWEAEERGLTPNTWWDEVGTTTNGTMELKSMFGDKVFNNPKPVSLIKKILLLGSQKESIVLDFFAGSGTTGHAVLELNKEDKGNRKFILCTNNENNICTEVCYPRIDKAINGYKNRKGEKIDGLGGNLKYFKTDFVGSDSTDKNKRDLVNKSAEMICIKEDIFDLVANKDFDYKIYQKGKKFLGVIFDNDAIVDFKKEAEKHKGNFVVYCFSYTEATPEKEFKGLKNKYVLKPIPAIILRVYSEIFRK